MPRRLALLLLCSIAGLSAAVADEPPLLLRVERRTPHDLADLRRSGFGVVHETRPCLFVRGSETDRRALAAAGLVVSTIDAHARDADHLVVGLRPDADLETVLAHGAVLLEEENWILLRVPRGLSLERLREGRVFVTRIPWRPVEVPAPPPPEGLRRAAEAGARAADPIVQRIVDSLATSDIDTYWQDLASNPPTGTRYSTHTGCRDAAAYGLGVFTSLGLPAEYQDWSSNHAPNVVATIEGAFEPDAVYLVEGHLDDLPASGPAPGANDNASGSANVLASAKAMSCWAFRRSAKFLLATGEELGLLGSEFYADDAFARGEDIRGVLNMDMIGWEGNGVPAQENLDLDYNGPSQWLADRFADAAAAYGTGLAVNRIYCPSLSASDHWPFWQKGWSAVCGITDNEGYCGHGGNYPDYHTSNDTIAACGNPAFFHSVVRTSVATLAELAGAFKIAFDREAYACGLDLRIVVGDRDLDLDPGAVETVAVLVTSATEPAGETIFLSERTVSSMLFEGTLPTTTAPAVGGDGLLSIAPGDSIEAEYVDALDCDGNPGVVYRASATADCAGPLISAVGEMGVSITTATIVWTTDEPADSVVRWGGTTPPGNETSNGALVTSHAVPLTGLQPCTVYWYEVGSTDGAGNAVRDDNGGFWHHFETLGDFGSGPQPCHEGRVSLDRAVAGCADSLPVRLVDLDLNLSPTAVDSATVTVSSTTETSPESLVLLESGPNTSTFTGSIPTAGGPAASSDGILQIGDRDLLTASYRDDDDGTGRPGRSFATGTADCGPPAIADLRLESLGDESAVVSWTTSEPATARVEWGPSPALGSVTERGSLATSHSLTIAPLVECGTFHFRVRSTDAYANETQADEGGSPFAFDAWRIPGLWRETFESPSSWTLEGEWQVGPPEGRGTSPGDPTAAFEGSRVLGHDLTGLGPHPGDYENGTNQRASSPVIDAASLENGLLVFRRWLNVGGGTANAYVEVKKGSTWNIVWQAGGLQGASDSAWSLETVDIAPHADGNAQMQIAFRQTGGLVSGGTRAGWNVDRVVVKSGNEPLFDACGGCGRAPAFAGIASAVDISGCAPTGVRLTWSAAPSWGTGRTGTYAVYRSQDPAFVPSPSNRIAAGIAGASFDDVSAPPDTTLWYVVRAENDETCGGGPANGGVVDDNVVRRSARDESSQPAPGDVGGTLRAEAVNGAHVRLSWAAAGGAARYRVERAAEPAGPFAVLGETTALFFEDADELGSLAARFYRLRALDSCGNAGP